MENNGIKYYKSTFPELKNGVGFLTHNQEADTLESVSKSDDIFGLFILEKGANEEMENSIPYSLNVLVEITAEEYQEGKNDLLQKLGLKSVVPA